MVASLGEKTGRKVCRQGEGEGGEEEEEEEQKGGFMTRTV